MSSSKRPIGAAKGKQSDTEALCQTPPPRPPAPTAWTGFVYKEGGGLLALRATNPKDLDPKVG